MIFTNALVIDDDPIFRLVAEDALRALGVENVDVAEDGASGLARIVSLTKAYDLIICDLQMPNLDGVSVVRELANINFSGALIIASSEADAVISAVQRMAIMVGVRILGAIKKPLTIGVLEKLLTQAKSEDRDAAITPMTRHGLKTAMIEKRLIPYYQPKLSLKLQKVTSAEVLTRVFSPEGNLMSLQACLKAAEQYDLMDELTLVIMDQTIADIENWNERGLSLDLSFNISPSMLRNLDLPDLLASRFKSAGIDLQTITLEVTEERLLDYDANVLEVLSRLRLLGFKLSIDDFGTGATSIEQLRLYPFNELKIDKTFIQGAQSDPFARTTVEASIRLAAMLDMVIVAEGVETEDDFGFVQTAGTHMVQGYLVSRALPADKLYTWLKEFDPKHLKHDRSAEAIQNHPRVVSV